MPPISMPRPAPPPIIAAERLPLPFFALGQVGSPQVILRAVQRHRGQTQFQHRGALEAAALVRGIDRRRHPRSLRHDRDRRWDQPPGSTTSPVNVSPAWLVFTLMR